MARLRLPFADALSGARPSTVGLVCLTLLWIFFQWRDPTPPPILDQILVASFSVWFANAAIEKKKEVDASSDNKTDTPKQDADK
jgi:hypothetical protein